ncbi:MAG: hypothetical protein P8Y71_13630 [Pseudolabrys sp.]
MLILGWLAYRPGLTGSFLFDDWANLPPLGAHGPVDSWRAVVTYVLSGVASATGRPVAMLSFLIDANNWPAAPEPFKYTNILIHLLNGALLTWLILRLSRTLGVSHARAAWAAVLGAGLWLLHPLMVSTTLFVVQRMAMLAATFVLGGLLCYLQGRRLIAAGRWTGGYLWMTTGIGLFGILAALSKENGALLPLFALVVEWIVLQHPSSSMRNTAPTLGWRVWKTVFLYAPLALLTTYLLAHVPNMLEGYSKVRDFTVGERLLTEGRVVVHYLALLLVPHAYTAGLYDDDIAVSTSLWHPWTTLPAVILILGLLLLGWKVRKRYPILALAIFFYFGGQLLESTFIPLELYFEHRNYLPATMLFYPLAFWLVTAKRPSPWVRTLISIGILAMLGTFTWARATLWGNPFEQAAVWARENPRSPRAQTNLALHWMRRGNYVIAARLLQRASQAHPGNVMIELNLMSAHCRMGRVAPRELERARRALAHSKIGNRVAYNAISRFIHHYKTTQCTGLDLNALDGLVLAALDNPHVRSSRGWLQDMLALRGELRVAQGEPAQAVFLFKESLHTRPRPDAALFEASLLGSAGYPSDGVALLDYFETLPQWSPSGFNVRRLRYLWLKHEGYYSDEIARIRRLLVKDVAEQSQK